MEATSDTGLVKAASARPEHQPSYFPIADRKETFSYNLKGKERKGGKTTFILIQALLVVQWISGIWSSYIYGHIRGPTVHNKSDRIYGQSVIWSTFVGISRHPWTIYPICIVVQCIPLIWQTVMANENRPYNRDGLIKSVSKVLGKIPKPAAPNPQWGPTEHRQYNCNMPL